MNFKRTLNIVVIPFFPLQLVDITQKKRYSESHVHSGGKTKVFQNRPGELRIKG